MIAEDGRPQRSDCFEARARFEGHPQTSVGPGKGNGTPGSITEIHDEVAETQEVVTRALTHDINNSLTAIMGNVSVALLGPDVDPSVRACLDEIRQACKGAAVLTRKLLILSRTRQKEATHIRVDELLESQRPFLCDALSEAIELRIEPCHRTGTVFADQTQIEQILLNLCHNAASAMPQGGTVTISTSLRQPKNPARSGSGRRVVVSVADTGAGMDRATVDKIFEPFFTTKTTKTRGTGLGLTIVKALVQRLNGSVEVSSRPNEGTRVDVVLPEATPRKGQHEPAAPARCWRRDLQGGNETVLVVEDDDLVMRFSCRLLRGLGYEVLQAGTGADALAAARSHRGPIHAVLMDVVVPDMNGKELSDSIRRTRSEATFLFTSGHTAEDLAGFGIDADVEAFISKPFDAATLATRLRQVIGA